MSSSLPLTCPPCEIVPSAAIFTSPRSSVIGPATPRTGFPSLVTRRPLSSRPNDPSRVYRRPPGVSIVKWPLATMERSRALPVKRRAPWVSIRSMPSTSAPISIVPMAGAPAWPMLCSSIELNGCAVLSLRLKPVVVAFARLLAMTSCRALSASSPLAAM